jgi:hypothetical protein
MSRIKEGLIGYDHDGWCEIDRAVMTDELTEYKLMNMTILEANSILEQSIVEGYREYTHEQIKKAYKEVFSDEQV